MMPYLALGVAVLFNAAANVLMRLGMKDFEAGEIEGVRDALREAWIAISRTKVALGIACMACFFGGYLWSLTRLDVSLAAPVSATSIVLGTLYAAVFLGEKVSWRRWLGIALVTGGAVLVGLTR